MNSYPVLAKKIIKDNKGATAVVVAIVLIVLLGFGALAIDIGHLYVVRNELQNAADAAALAGARDLYTNKGQAINEGANQTAYDAAIANKSEQNPVEVRWTTGQNDGSDIERGHWSFTSNHFTANSSTTVVPLWGVPTSELDQNINFINAVHATARRETIPAFSFLSRIFGFESFVLQADAVAYIGFVGSLNPAEADQPIAICEQAILNNGVYDCSRGRMINSGANSGHQTGGWTNFSSPCATANPPTVRPYICGGSTAPEVLFDSSIGTVGGMQKTDYTRLRNCWINPQYALDTNGDGLPDKPWKMLLPVVDCPGNNTSNCSKVTGAVVVEVVWITLEDKNQMKEVPRYWSDTPTGYVNPRGSSRPWICDPPISGQQCWNEFVDMLKLHDVLTETPATYENATIYFKPSCEKQELAGNTGGKNFGVLALIPVLVE